MTGVIESDSEAPGVTRGVLGMARTRSLRTLRVNQRKEAIMEDDSIGALKAVKYSAIAVGGLMVAGILTLMVLARGKTGDDGDMAGVVAPAVLLTCVSGLVAAVAAVRQKRVQRTGQY
jgi:hypothetical protein